MKEFERIFFFFVEDRQYFHHLEWSLAPSAWPWVSAVSAQISLHGEDKTWKHKTAARDFYSVSGGILRAYFEVPPKIFRAI